MFDALGELFKSLLLVFAAAALLGALGLALLDRRLRRLRVPPNADFVTTIRAVPFGLVLALDLLDFGLDIFAAPFSWIILSRYKLQGLRNLAVVESLVPFTEVIPTLSLAWIGVRMLGLQGAGPGITIIDVEESAPGQYGGHIERKP